MSDEELLQSIQKGDSKAFESLLKKYKSHVYGLSRRILGASMLAEENSQEVWMKVIGNASSFQGKGSVKSWILRITKNQALNLLEKRGWEEPLPDLSSEGASEDSAAESDRRAVENWSEEIFQKERALEQVVQIEKIKQALDQLPDRQRVVLVLWMQEELSMEELSKQMGLSLSAVKVLLFRAKENLKKEIGSFS